MIGWLVGMASLVFLKSARGSHPLQLEHHLTRMSSMIDDILVSWCSSCKGWLPLADFNNTKKAQGGQRQADEGAATLTSHGSRHAGVLGATSSWLAGLAGSSGCVQGAGVC